MSTSRTTGYESPIVVIRLAPTALASVDQLAADLGVTRSRVIQDAVAWYVRKRRAAMTAPAARET